MTISKLNQSKNENALALKIKVSHSVFLCKSNKLKQPSENIEMDFQEAVTN